DAERRRWLEALGGASAASKHSDAVEVLPPAHETSPIDTFKAPGSVEAPMVTASERAAIIAAAQQEPSRRKVCQAVFGTAGGRAWDKVKRVCDEAGLLMSETRLAVAEEVERDLFLGFSITRINSM